MGKHDKHTEEIITTQHTQAHLKHHNSLIMFGLIKRGEGMNTVCTKVLYRAKRGEEQTAAHADLPKATTLHHQCLGESRRTDFCYH